MASNEHEAEAALFRQQAERRSKRQRVEETSEALAHALLETVRQALDGGISGAECGASQFQEVRQQPCEQALLEGGARDNAGEHVRGMHEQELHDKDQELVAYVWVDNQRRGSAAQRPRKWSIHPEQWHPDRRLEEQERVAEQPEPPGCATRSYPFNFVMPEMAMSARETSMPCSMSLREQQRPSSGASHPPQAGTPSHGSANTTLDAGTYDIVDDGDDRAQAAAAEESNEGFVPRKKQSSPKPGVPGGPCAHCGTLESPQWRRPLTKKVVLCNACGIYFSRHHSLPRRKKMPGSVAQAASRAAKAADTPPPREEALSLIICEEMLEVEDQATLAPTPANASTQQAPAVLMPRSLATQEGAAHGRDVAVPAAPPGQTPGALGKTVESAQERLSLSLPLLTALPVLGGINIVVQTFLNPNAAGL